MPVTVIELHRDAPLKPTPGAPCNGCGVCCALETCPLGRLRFLRRRGPCPALTWSLTERRYQCGLLTSPATWFSRLPRRMDNLMARACARWIAAGIGCDCNADCPD